MAATTEVMLRRGELVLVNAADLGKLGERELPAPLQAACKQIVDWAHGYLCRPHSKLGREGPVCPFTPGSLRTESFWLTVREERELDIDRTAQQLQPYLDWFLELEPRSGPESILKAILILYPHLSPEDAAKTLDPVQRMLKPGFVKRGIMIGQFYAGCPESGLWNASFRALESPLPLLAIRHMVPSDFPFLYGDRGNAEMLGSYLERFGPEIPRDVRALIVEALDRTKGQIALQPAGGRCTLK